MLLANTKVLDFSRTHALTNKIDIIYDSNSNVVTLLIPLYHKI